MPPPPATTSAPLHGEPLPVELMNTIWADRHTVHDAIDDPAGVTGWLTAVGLLPGPKRGASVGASAAADLRRLRDALRRLAADATDDERASAPSPIGTRASALAVLNQIAGSAPSWPQLAWPRNGRPSASQRSDSTRTELVVASLAAQGIELFAGPDLAELRACGAPGCVLYLVRDHPRKEWCSVACGNRARAARHYQRHHHA